MQSVEFKRQNDEVYIYMNNGYKDNGYTDNS